MASQQILLAADSIVATRLAFDYWDDRGLLSPGSTAINGFCPTKKPGQLRMSINLGLITQPFGIVLDSYVDFMGTVSSPNTVLWETDQKIDRYIPQFDVTLNRLTGTFTTLLMSVSPAAHHPGCDGLNRSYGLRLDTDTTRNELVLSVHKGTLLGDVFDSVHATNLVFHATAGQYVDTKVRIVFEYDDPQNHCSIAWVEGAAVTLYALVTGLPSGVGISNYLWDVQGAEPTTLLTSSTIGLSLPSPPALVTVKVTVTLEDGSEVSDDHLRGPVFSKAEASHIEAACLLSYEIGAAAIRVPPWDTGDPRVRVSHADLQILDRIATRIIAAAERFKNAIKGVQ